MSGFSFIKSTKGKVILATAAALHITIYIAKPSLFKQKTEPNNIAAPPKYLPEK